MGGTGILKPFFLKPLISKKFDKSLTKIYNLPIFFNEEVSLANHPSALKRAKQNKVRRLRNASMKSKIKTKVKQYLQTLETSSQEPASPDLIKAVSLIDRAGSKGILHQRTASRKISRLSKKLNKASGQTKAQA
jgi:small subunit ribosomal protein S20